MVEPLHKIRKIDESSLYVLDTPTYQDEQQHVALQREYLSDARRSIWLKLITNETDFDVKLLKLDPFCI